MPQPSTQLFDTMRQALRLKHYAIRTEVLGSKGGLLIGKSQFTPVLVMTQNGVTHDTVPFFMERFGDAYAAEIRDFIGCIQDGRELSVSGKDARLATAIEQTTESVVIWMK